MKHFSSEGVSREMHQPHDMLANWVSLVVPVYSNFANRGTKGFIDSPEASGQVSGKAGPMPALPNRGNSSTWAVYTCPPKAPETPSQRPAGWFSVNTTPQASRTRARQGMTLHHGCQMLPGQNGQAKGRILTAALIKLLL